MSATPASVQPGGGKALRISLWAAQLLIGLPFCLFGFMKLSMPIAELSKTMKWTAEHSPAFVHFTGLVDIVGGLGMLLPSLTRIKPRLTVAAAVGCIVLQIVAATFHVSRGEANLIPLNIVLLALSAFVLWGRSSKAPIAPRA